MRVGLTEVTQLRFADGSPVRAASAIAPYGDGWLVAQDDATHACWLRGGVGTPVRLLPAVDGREVFAEAEGTKHLKPDLESACVVPDGVLLLGSGSTPARMRAVLLGAHDDAHLVVADLSALYAAAASALAVSPGDLNLEGACVIGETLRWFHRGRPSAGLPTASVDLDLAGLLEAVRGRADAGNLAVTGARTYDLGDVAGIGLAVTDAVSLGDQVVLVSAAAEDSPTAYDDGPVVGAALALLEGDAVLDVAQLRPVAGGVVKIEGLAVLDWAASGGRLLATVDQDDPGLASSLLTLSVWL
ncbi:MAG: hypothetical protein M3237_10810 [Actinomycetota bacterium]|nr:hypothetical protein [Actinomycetota bacterium]